MSKKPKNQNDDDREPRDESAEIESPLDADEPQGIEGEAEAEPADELEQLRAEKEELFARLQRTTADYQNYMKRSAENLPIELRRAEGAVLKRFIPVLDHFDNALSHEPDSDEAKSVYDGMRIVRDELMQVLRQCGVETIAPQPGDVFDPHRHQAMLQQAVEGVEPRCVSILMQAGYRCGDLTLRPAKVAVAPEEESSPEP